MRAPHVPDPAGLADALARGGIRALELTFTTPGVLDLIRIASDAGAVVGAGTVLTADQARSAIGAGARFVVTPGLRPDVAAVVTDAGIPLMMGALTPTEVMTAIDLGSDAVKIFPARTVGTAYFKDLRGPFPDARLVPSGGVNIGNAAQFLAHGAVAVTAGTDIVPPAAVAAAQWDDIATRTTAFVAAINTYPREGTS